MPSKNKKVRIVPFSQYDRFTFSEFFLLLAGGLGALGIEDILSAKWWIGIVKMCIAYLSILGAARLLRIPDNKR